MSELRRVIALAHLQGGPDATTLGELEAALGTAPGVVWASLRRHHPRSVGAGDATWDALVTRTPVQPEAVRAELEVVEPQIVACGIAPESLPTCVKRTLLLRVDPEAPPAEVADLERALAAMPHHITAIRSWALSRVAGPAGSRWTHVWEQEFATIDGVLSDYMVHPHHWSHVDRWFDPEHPRCIVDPVLAHAVAEPAEPVLARVLSATGPTPR